MNPCVYCGEIFRIEQRRCPQCGEANHVPAAMRSRFDRIQLAVKVGDLNGNTAAQFQAEALALLRQDMALPEIAREMERVGNGRYAGYIAILRNLSG
jgi:hypothetical protein